MITGNCYLALPIGKPLDVVYEFSSDYDDRRAGYLLCDTTETDPSAFYVRLLLTCEDGAAIVISVCNPAIDISVSSAASCSRQRQQTEQQSDRASGA